MEPLCVRFTIIVLFLRTEIRDKCRLHTGIGIGLYFHDIDYKIIIVL